MIALTIIKELPVGEEWIILNRNFVIVQVAANAFLLAVLLGVSAVYGWNVIQSCRHGMSWTKRRSFVVRVRFQFLQHGRAVLFRPFRAMKASDNEPKLGQLFRLVHMSVNGASSVRETQARVQRVINCQHFVLHV